MNLKKVGISIVGIAASLYLVGCGGGGGSAGITAGSVSPTPTQAASSPTQAASTPTVILPTAADFVFQLDKTTILNSGTDRASLTVQAVDANRNVVAGVPVLVSVDADGVFSPAGQSLTDVTGSYTGSISIGGNKSNRIVNVKMTLSGIVKSASVVVSGSQLTLTPSNATPSLGEKVDVTVSSKASDGLAIQGAKLNYSGSAVAGGGLTTDASGIAVFTFNAPNVAGDYLVTVTGLGTSKTLPIKVIAPGGVGRDPALGAVKSVSLSPQPTSIAPNLNGSVVNRSTLSAKFLTDNNVAIKDMRVRFLITAPILGGGEFLSSTGTVFSDVNGVAQVDYVAGSRSSPTNGVVITACYSPVDFTVATGCPPASSAEYKEVKSNLTVAGAPLSISIGSDNTTAKGLGGIAYIRQFLIQVNDAAGVAIKDAIVTPSVDITHYGKGTFGNSYPRGVVPPNKFDSSLVVFPDGSVGASISTPPATIVSTSATGVKTSTSYNIWCENEDKNRNGFLESDERINSNDTIEPRKAEVIVSYVSGNKTDINGQLLIQVSYPQNVATWLSYTIRATTAVEGSEGDASKSFVTVPLQDDVANGSFRTPPYGFGACNSVN